MDNALIPAWERRLVTAFTKLLWFRTGRRRGRARPVPDWLPHDAFTIRAADGARLAARWFPSKDPKGTIVFAHPDRRYAQDWFVLTGWLDLTKRLGLNALTFDFPHYGESRGGSSYYYEHLIAALAEARRRAPHRPLHVVGVSLGAFTAANATRDFPVDGLILESPYPTFQSWYGGGPTAAILRGFERAFPRTAHRIDARQSLRGTQARRVLVVASEDDTVTPIHLSEALADAGPPERTRFLRLQGPQHLDLFLESAEYRAAVAAFLTRPTHSGTATHALLSNPNGVPRSAPHRTRPRLQPRPSARAHHGQGGV